MPYLPYEPKPDAPSIEVVVAVVKEALRLMKGCCLPRSNWSPLRLGQESPLARGPFMARFLEVNVKMPLPTSEERGRFLADKFLEVAEVLKAEAPEDWEKLDAYYFTCPPGKTAKAIARSFFMTDINLFKLLKRIVLRFTELLFQQVSPALCPEPIPMIKLSGRTAQITAMTAQLEAGQTVALTGAAGVGKTALATVVAHRWGVEQVMRYTIQKGLTDSLSNFVFALAHFLYQQGLTQLWARLAVHGGELHEMEPLPHLLRAVLQDAGAKKCLLWIDDLHLLTRADPLLRLLESLVGQVPMLWVGQPPLPGEGTSHNITLTGLTLHEVEEWLADHDLRPPTPLHAQELHTVTQGVPALLNLWLQATTSANRWNGALYTMLAHNPEKLLGQLWAMLSEGKQALLQHLAVFRQPAPEEVFKPVAQALQELHQHQLLERDENLGQVWLRPAMRDWVLEKTDSMTRAHYHQLAAKTYTEWGDYTEAAYYWAAGGEPVKAVEGWFEQRHGEYRKGRGADAAAIFQNVDPAMLPTTTREKLKLVLAELRARDWNDPDVGTAPTPPEPKPPSHPPHGGYPASGHNTPPPPPTEPDAECLPPLAQAWREAAYAQATVKKLFGKIAEAAQDFGSARQCYQEALDWAEKSGDAALCGEMQACLDALDHGLGSLPATGGA